MELELAQGAGGLFALTDRIHRMDRMCRPKPGMSILFIL
jgi:hypothetical protein